MVLRPKELMSDCIVLRMRMKTCGNKLLQCNLCLTVQIMDPSNLQTSRLKKS